jgi:hypothetical protein
MNDVLCKTVPRPHPALSWLGLLLVAVLSIAPLAAIAVAQDRAGAADVQFLLPHSSLVLDWGSKALVLAAMVLVIGLRAWVDRRQEPGAGQLAVDLMVAALALIGWHALWVDARHEEWQRDGYLAILNRRAGAPHQFRALPYGFTRGLELVTGDWWFSCLAYRWFFTYWFLWGCYRFARLFLDPAMAVTTLLPVVLLYPLSVFYYCGQLTDPLSHALFVLALIYVIEDRWLALAAALFLGVLAKETVVLAVPAYLACYWRRGGLALVRTAALGVACVAAFLLARLPLGWQPGYEHINGTEALMIGSNLGIDWPALGIEPLYLGSAPIAQNYLHPLLFVGSFLPWILVRWKWTDPRLHALFLILVPMLLASNLCFGWMYESRNYMPLVPLLATMARGRPRQKIPTDEVARA